MTVRNRLALVLLPLFFIVLAFAMLMPLGFAAEIMGLTARTSQGTIMSGSLRDVSVGKVRIGDINAKLRILPLLTGGVSFALQRGDAPHAPGVTGAIGRRAGGLFADEVSATLSTDGLIKGLDGGQLQFEKLSFSLSDNQCAIAKGTVRLTVEDSALGSVVRGGMLGEAQCRKGDVVFNLMSQSTMERATIRFKANGQYQLTFYVAEPNPELSASLALAGFQPVAGGYRLIRRGSLH